MQVTSFALGTNFLDMYWRKDASYFLIMNDNELGMEKLRRILKEKEKKIIMMCHNGIYGMHFGHDKNEQYLEGSIHCYGYDGKGHNLNKEIHY